MSSPSPAPIEIANNLSGGYATRLVLVVDDDPVVRSMTVRALRRARFKTLEADSAVAALDVLAGQQIGVVLVDQVMPGMTGIELTRAIRSTPEHRMTPVLFLSAAPSPKIRIQAFKAGATDFMAKPVALNEMVARVEAQLRVTTGWRSTLAGLQQRVVTVADLAEVGSELNPTVTARLICDRISRAYGGAAVAIYSCADDACSLLANVGARPRLVEDTEGGSPMVSQQAEAGPWIHHDRPRTQGAGRAGWWACAPLRRGRVPLGVLVIEGRQTAGTSSADQLLAAAVDYAATAALHLAVSLGGTHRARQHRSSLQRILSDGTFGAVFQPIVDLRDDRVVGYEALTRFGDGEPVGQRLIDADEAGMRPRFELALLAAALAHTVQLGDSAWMSINLSPSVLVLHTEELVELLGATTTRVVVELTENERIDDYEAVRAALARLGPNVDLSIDDTGAGYASLRHVVDLRPDYLKLDRSWISGLEHDDARRALVAGLAAFCEHTGTDLIAEGVETAAERAALEALGVCFAQGYLLGRPGPLPNSTVIPLSLESVTQWLDPHPRVAEAGLAT